MILHSYHHPLPLILLVVLLARPSASEPTNQKYLECRQPTPYRCGNQTYDIAFPFGSPYRPNYCSYPEYYLVCWDSVLLFYDDYKDVYGALNTSNFYQVKSIDYTKQALNLTYHDFANQSCPPTLTEGFINSTLFNYADSDVNLTIYINCTDPVSSIRSIDCKNGDHWYYSLEDLLKQDPSLDCASIVSIPLFETIVYSLLNGTMEWWDAVQEGFSVKWTVGQDWCGDCLRSGGACGYDSGMPDTHTCFCPNTTTHNGTCKIGGKSKGKTIAIGVGVGVGVASLLAGCCCFLLYQQRKRRQRSTSSNLLIRSTSSKASSMKDPELGSINYRTHVFSYEELQAATNGFDVSKELGDGGFGTVYKGELRDGRVVAVKRLYENNYKRVEQFLNEVDILSRLRHQNLVTLYGCTSRHSRELLLVYEFVPNGTVADHLHGPRAPEGGLTWAIRLNIAIETADALGYLHAVEPQIIHRDVKTNNILLDNGFHVKVADFGLSRLFPVHATHVSTLPQGTPGYVDPEYHQCYQLTDKSDVYSFGVVLVELISSKPAVDISRHRNEINLATMAITKIQQGKLDQLVDPGLGFREDWETKRMITMVAELAFRCLQGDRDMRPCIKEVVGELRVIQGRGEKEVEANIRTKEDMGLLKNTMPYSPDSVTARWDSRLTTPNTSS